MARRASLATVAVTRGEFALLVFHDAMTDARTPGVVDEIEAPAVAAAMSDWMLAVKADRTAQSVALAIQCGVGANDPRYLESLIDAYREALDEAPLDAA
jgi:hypothetical protein